MIVALAVLVVAGLAFADWRPTGGGGFAGEPGRFAMRHRCPDQLMMLRLILHTLDLTDEQRELIEEILDEARPDMEAAQEAVAEASTVLREAVMQGADEDTIRAAASALGDAIGDQAVLKARTMASIKAVLTEEQLAELEELLARRAEVDRLLVRLRQLCGVMD
jgi:Spy/CpxP family protein refolding chaperone